MSTDSKNVWIDMVCLGPFLTQKYILMKMTKVVRAGRRARARMGELEQEQPYYVHDNRAQ